jgi:hypothetical protein
VGGWGGGNQAQILPNIIRNIIENLLIIDDISYFIGDN